MSEEPLAGFDPDGAGGSDGLFGLPHRVDQARVRVIPAPFEATTSYRRGTRGAPAAILQASHQVDLYQPDTGEAWRQGIAMEEVDPRIPSLDRQVEADALAVIEAGGATEPALEQAAARVNQAGERLNQLVAARCRGALDQGQIPAVLGGDHAVPFGAIEQVGLRHPGLGLLVLDAHADLRPAYEDLRWSHASIFHNVLELVPGVHRIVQVGLRDVGHVEVERLRTDPRMRGWFDRDLQWELADGRSWRSLCTDILVDLPEAVWISVDIDGLSPALCPHTGTPVPGGLSWSQAMILLRMLGESGRRILGFDLCEVGPGQWDAIVGARMLYSLASWAIHTSGDA